MLEVRSAAELMSMVHVRVLHVAASTTLGEHPRVIGALDGDAPAAVQSVMNVHPVPHIVKITVRAVGAHAHHITVRRAHFVTSYGTVAIGKASGCLSQPG